MQRDEKVRISELSNDRFGRPVTQAPKNNWSQKTTTAEHI